MKTDKSPTSDEGRGHLALVDGSRLITESCVRAGADAYVGYPITPANLVYTYAGQRFPMVLPAPDEITSLQWMAGLAAVGHLPVTATSFPGFALMVESINLAYMMELPMLVVLVQRLGPAIGTATGGAQGDLLLQHGMISGGYPVPVFCIADMNDCWRLPPVALRTAVELRTPVVLLTSKEMAMTEVSFDIETLEEIKPIPRVFYDSEEPYRPYAPDEKLVPAFLPVGNERHQVRLTGSTHDTRGLLQFSTDEALSNTRRLPEKIERGTPVLYDLDEQDGAETLVLTHGITTGPAREAVEALRTQGVAVSLLVAQTLLPVPNVYFEILDRYSRVVAAEENLQGQLAHLLFGQRLPEKLKVVGGIGRMIRPEQIAEGVKGG
jgi:2-oxoglutarate ferredoxin oxidoreductase subunit alpha